MFFSYFDVEQCSYNAMCFLYFDVEQCPYNAMFFLYFDVSQTKCVHQNTTIFHRLHVSTFCNTFLKLPYKLNRIIRKEKSPAYVHSHNAIFFTLLCKTDNICSHTAMLFFTHRFKTTHSDVKQFPHKATIFSRFDV